MSLLIDITRGLVIAVLAMMMARSLMSIVKQRWIFIILITWIAVPALAVAYVWAALPIPFSHHTWLSHVTHSLLSAGRLAPIVMVIMSCIPPAPLDAVAFYCMRLAARGKKATLMYQWWRNGPGRNYILVTAFIFPLAFSEFEIASRLNVGGWSVRLFDAQAGGQFLSLTISQAAFGVFVQVAALICAWWLMRTHQNKNVTQLPIYDARWLRITGWLLLMCGSAALVAFPVITLVMQASSGLASAWSQINNLRSEIYTSLLFAAIATVCVWLLAGLFNTNLKRFIYKRVIVSLSMLPGLCGSLVVGLAILTCCQLSIFRPLANTPVPLLTALIILLLPYALILYWMSTVSRSSIAYHDTTLLYAGNVTQSHSARHARWLLVGQKRWWAFVLLYLWGYCDLAASAILHPLEMTPALVRLYNLMHYGQSTALSVQLIMTLLVPLVLMGFAYFIVRIMPWHRWPRLMKNNFIRQAHND